MLFFILLACVVLYFVFAKNTASRKHTAIRYIALGVLVYVLTGVVPYWIFQGLFLISLSAETEVVTTVLVYLQTAVMLALWVVSCVLFLKIAKRMLREQDLSNTFIYWYMGVVITCIMLGVATTLWGVLPGAWAILGVLVALVGWMALMRKVYTTTNRRCDQCRVYPGEVSWIGMTKDGIREVRSHDVDRHRSERNLDSRTIEEEDVTINTWTTKYYQMYKDHYCCHLCGNRWTVRFRGEYLGKDVKQHTETETTHKHLY